MEGASGRMPRSSGRPPRGGDKEGEDKASFKLKIPPTNRGTRYKEKFQALRVRYEEVTKEREDYERDLDIAAAKIKRLQEENDLLLDAISVSSPNLINPVPSNRGPDSQHPTPDMLPRSVGTETSHGDVPRPSYFAPHASQTNGNPNGRSNGSRHRPTEPNEHDSLVNDQGP